MILPGYCLIKLDVAYPSLDNLINFSNNLGYSSENICKYFVCSFLYPHSINELILLCCLAFLSLSSELTTTEIVFFFSILEISFNKVL